MPSDSKTAKKAKTEKTEEKKKRVRRDVNKDTLAVDMLALKTKLDTEILRLSQEKIPGVKFLRSVGKMFRVLSADTVRVLKMKPKVKRENAGNSGFNKPVKITEELRSFAKWEAGEFSRIAVTKMLCAYVKEHKLQDPEDGRTIIPDKTLAKLLYGDEKKTDKLTYFVMQKHIQKHFIKPPPVDAATAKKNKKEAAAKKKDAKKKADDAKVAAAPADSKVEAKAAPVVAEKTKKAAAVASAKKQEKSVDVEDDEDE